MNAFTARRLKKSVVVSDFRLIRYMLKDNLLKMQRLQVIANRNKETTTTTTTIYIHFVMFC